MPKEDRSDWVAVEPEFAASSNAEATDRIEKAKTAYQFFQKDVTEQVKEDLIAEHGKFDIAVFGRTVRDRWNALSDDEKRPYQQLAAQDASRYAQEMHQADVAAMERRERLRQERDQLVIDDTEGQVGKRTTRHKWAKKQRKEERKNQRKQEKTKKKRPADNDDDEDYQDDDDDDSMSSLYDSSSESSSQAVKRTKPVARKVSQKQIEYRAKVQREKQEKELYIANRQQDLRREKATQAKKRLEFLLQQSNIFSHFGRVKEDTAKYGIKTAATTTTPATTGGQSSATVRRMSNGEEAQNEDLNQQELEEADEHEATYLTTQPSTLGFGKMRDYQLEGLNWMIRLQENGVNGILADEMGLGKTLQSISILVYMMEYQNITGPHLVVVPKSTLSNWMNELERWAPTLTAIRFHGDKATREDMVKTILEPAQRDEDRDWNVIVTTYEVCNIEKNALSKFAWSYLIIDEAHRLKNEASAFSQTVRMFETRYRILITGTPLQNSLHELWALLNFLVPDVFESADQFDEWFNLDIDDNDEKNKLISQLHKILRPFMLRRLKADVETSLPPKHETILFTGMSKMQKDLYRNILIRDIDAIQGTSGSRTAILNIVMQLRKCAGHPYLFPGVEDRTLPPLGEHLVENCGKMVLLDKLLKRLRERGHRVLLFTQMTRILDILEDYLVMRQFPYCRIDGNTSYDDREARIDDYNAPDSDKFLFLLSTRAGGLGINLQTADVVIIYDSDWNPQMDLQAQDRAHRIGQKKPVQVFRLVTEHTIEEKIVERAQQKLKLDAMVVQSGRLKEKDKLSRDELLTAVRFGADKIFKSKDSSITDDDIDLILDVGKKKTQELNEKLTTAEKGDLLDFKFDGSSVKTFEGVDYSASALAQAKAEAEILGIFDIGKRERKEANYNENSLYQQQIAALGQAQQKKKKKRKLVRLPKSYRLPKMDEWQMYDRETLTKIQEEEEAAFKALPEEQQKLAIAKPKSPGEEDTEDITENNATGADLVSQVQDAPFELPPLIGEERRALKEDLLKEGFSSWKRPDYTAFVRSSARFGRQEFEKIAAEVGKSEIEVREFANSFWGERGRTRISEHEYEKAVKLIERGEKKLGEIKSLEHGTRLLVSLFDNPWEELEFSFVNCRDKMFTPEEDRHLLCWARKYGYGQWMAISMAVRRNPKFRFNYFLRSLPVEQLGRRCEQLMRAAEKEVEHLERNAREAAGLSVEPEKEGDVVPPVELPKFRILNARLRKERQEKAAKEKKQLENNANELEEQIRTLRERLATLNEGADITQMALTEKEEAPKDNGHKETESEPDPEVIKPKTEAKKEDRVNRVEDDENREVDGALGPDGEFVKFPAYDGEEEPSEWKKPFTHFCIRTRKQVKQSLDPSERKDKSIVNGILKKRWVELTEKEKLTWRQWSEWDQKRYARDVEIYNRRQPKARQSKSSTDNDSHIPKKKRKSLEGAAIPKKRKR